MTSDPFTSRGLIPCLTVKQPYALGLVANMKPVENRPWAPPRWLVGRRLLIHAGLCTEYLDNPFAMRKFRGLWVKSPRTFARGAIVGHVRIDGSVPIDGRPVLCPWSIGPCCWLSKDGVEIEPIPYRGGQRIFGVPARILPMSLVEAMRG